MKHEVSFSVDAKHTLSEAKFVHESPPRRAVGSFQCSVFSGKAFVRHKAAGAQTKRPRGEKTAERSEP